MCFGSMLGWGMVIRVELANGSVRFFIALTFLLRDPYAHEPEYAFETKTFLMRENFTSIATFHPLYFINVKSAQFLLSNIDGATSKRTLTILSPCIPLTNF